jgi:hypothetical protein
VACSTASPLHCLSSSGGVLRDQIRRLGVSPGVVACRADSIPPDAIARAIGYAIDEPAEVDVNELVIRPARQR